MNNCLDIFNNIQNSVDELSESKHISFETKQSALDFKHAIESCILEIKRSANRLNSLTSISSKHLRHTENMWSSKPTIIGSSRHEIWADIGNLSGFDLQIDNFINQLKNEVILETKKSWNGRFEYLKNKHFIDAKGIQKKGVGWDEKAKFTDDIKNDVKKHCDYTVEVLEKKMQLIYAEFENMNLKTLHNCLSLKICLLPEQKQSKLMGKINLIQDETKSKFKNPVNYLPKNILHINEICSSDLKALVDKAWGDIIWEDFCKFDNIFLIKLEKFIAALFDDRAKFITEAIDKLILFYNHFLEMQERYQQETLEQREAEKLWIEKQFKELEKLQTEISIIVNAS